MLLRTGYNFVQYSSHERIVESNKEQYYLSLRKAQKELKELPEPDTSPVIWAEFFLTMLKKQKDLLYKKIVTVHGFSGASPSSWSGLTLEVCNRSGPLLILSMVTGETGR
jgi:hypothetical protein